VFTGPTQAPWYSPRGVFLDPPTVELAADGWRVVLPPGVAALHAADAVPTNALCFTKDGLFSAERDNTALCEAYRALISAALADAALHADGEVGAAIIEPVMHGASGMVFVDPAFQRAVAAVCRAQHIPLIADEVFSGLWRLGAISASQLLGIQPDVACYAKLLTGGSVPLAATLASEDVFDAFRGAEKTDALLHGHSYSAHAIGCAAACSALDMFADAATNPNLLPGGGAFVHPHAACLSHDLMMRRWRTPAGAVGSSSGGIGAIGSRRDARCVHRHRVRRRACRGIRGVRLSLQRCSRRGQAAEAARCVVAACGSRPRSCLTPARVGVFARPLGNVLYLMVTPMTQPDACSRLLQALLTELPQRGAQEDERLAVVC
jgi:dethiobiotin synthetase/adenosylmethionine--8-amino-7-oxononanoate aminotransferase